MTAKIDGTNGVLQQYDYQAPTTGFSYTFAAGTTVLVMNPAGTLATGAITMPAAPADGMTISFSSTQQITALTVNANTGQSIVGNPTTMLAGGASTFVYRLSNTTWYAQTNTAGLGLSSGTPTVTTYVSPASWSKPSTLKAVRVTCIGAGGPGGSASATAPGPTVPGGATGGGGGGGGIAIGMYPAPVLPVSAINITVGAGGTPSTFGGIISATSGANGGNGANSVGLAGAGGSGNTGSPTQIQMYGIAGTNGNPITIPTGGSGGAGGISNLYTGLPGAGASSGGPFSSALSGSAGTGYGSGSGGSIATATVGSGPRTAPATAGAPGVVIIEEYY